MSYKGIDVSENNGTVDWDAVATAGYEFAIIRTGYGRYATDDQFEANYKGAKAAGLKIGVYHYSYALNASSAQTEAELVQSIISGKDIDLGIWFDMEDADSYKSTNGLSFTKSAITAICQAFLDEIPEAGIYASKSWFGSYIDVDSLGNPPIWVAQWNSTSTYTGDYIMWQYSDSGVIGSKTFDLNYYYGDLETDTETETTTTEEDDEDMGELYTYLTDIPNDYGFQDIIEKLMDAGVIKGDGSDATGNGDVISLYHSQVRLLVFIYRGGGFDKALTAAGLAPVFED